ADGDYSEIEAAKRAADQLQIENFSYVITPEEYIEKIPEIMWHLGDPLADPSCVPLYFVAREARKQVDAVLSGEGADELFGGYNIYREPGSLKVFEFLPKSINRSLQRLAIVFPEGMKGKSFLERGTTPIEERYIGNAKMFSESEKQQLLKDYDASKPYQLITEKLYQDVAKNHDVHKMQYIDIHTWLPGDILLKAEKMTHAHSLEVRTPFLDKEVFQIARHIPVHEKIGKGETKLILREAFKGFVPDDILYRKKLGFPVPMKHWLKRELYTWARDVIIDSPTDHIIHKKPVLQLLEKHRQNKGNHARKIWTILMFMIWYQIYIEQVYNFGNDSENPTDHISEKQKNMCKFSESHHIKIRQPDTVWRKRLRKYRFDPVFSQPYYFVNSIIRIYSRSGPICSFVGPFLTTYSPNRLVLVMMKFTLVNSIIWIYSQSGTICSFVESS